MDDIDRALSLKLYDAMDQVGVSVRCRKLYQDEAITGELIETIKSQINNDTPTTTYIFGSSSEGTTTIGLHSDVDTLKCIDGYPAIDDIRAAPRGQSYLMIRDNYTYPGYVKLQIVYDGTPLHAELQNDFFEADNKGRLCIKHLRCCHCGINGHDHERHGPSDASQEKPGFSMARDNVWALRCRTIPVSAQTWLKPRRRYNWPSRDNLQKMGELGCFVVGVGHSSSREQHIEWRISFSLQERLLMFSLNSTQHKCYVILKMIKKDIIKAEIGECLSSYHCKTCLFQAIKVTSAEMWRPDNLVSCVRLCLLILLKWVVNGVCPNYFIPSENMFEKPQFHAKRHRLLDLLRELIADGNSIILRLRCEHISNRILHPKILYCNHYTDYLICCAYIRTSDLIDNLSYYLYRQVNNSPVICQNIMTLFQHIERLTNTCVMGEHTEQQTRDAKLYVIPVLHQHIAQRLASLACKDQGHETRLLLYLSIHHFQHGNHADLMTSRLLVVSLFLRLEKYDLCEHILKDIENDCKNYVVTHCNCYNKIYVANSDIMQHLSRNNISCKTAIKNVFVGCVRFTRCDTEIAPLPLHYEMYRSIGSTPLAPRDDNENSWLEWAVVDGKVYLYFLQYLVYSRLNRPANKQVAIDNLVWVLGSDPDLRHVETAFNLLGWIHVQEGRMPEALRCFVTSWRIRPDHNAAKLHVLNLYSL